MAKGEHLIMAPQEDNVESVKVRRGKFDSLSLYEVTESELQELECGGQDDVMLNVGIFLLSTAISFLISLLTTKIESLKTYCVFVLIAIVGFVGSVILLILWNRTRKSRAAIVKRIKDRMPSDTPTDRNAQQTDAVDKK